MIVITPRVAIDASEIDETFIQAGGPGGQNVNKVASAVQLRFDAAQSPSLDEPMRARLRRLAGRRMTADGILVITARRFRTQARNREDAYARLVELIGRAVRPARPRVATRPTAAARQRRRADKSARSLAKSRRRPVATEE